MKSARQRGKAEARRFQRCQATPVWNERNLRTETLQCVVLPVKEIPARTKDGTIQVAGCRCLGSQSRDWGRRHVVSTSSADEPLQVRRVRGF